MSAMPEVPHSPARGDQEVSLCKGVASDEGPLVTLHTYAMAKKV